MQRAALALTVLVGVAIGSADASACSCAGWANAQQAAQVKGAIVAKVRTVKLLGDGRGRIQVQKIYKGKLSSGTITVTGQDGSNCNGDLLDRGPSWIVLMVRTNGKFQTLSCADTALPINPATGKIIVSLGEETQLNEGDFRKVIDYKIQPSVKGLSCFVHARRNVVPFDHEAASALDLDYKAEASSTNAHDLKVALNTNLSSQGPKLASLLAEATAVKKTATKYEFTTTLTEPFFSKTLRGISTIDTKESTEPIGAYFHKDTDLDGRPDPAPEQPFIAHDASLTCQLKTGLPLVPVD